MPEQLTATSIPALLRRGAVTVAAGRVALGLTALAWPAVPARPWVGASADDLAARVFGRALGARDLALGLGALAALQGPGAEPGSAAAWVAAGALSDALDVAASVASWRELPRVTRWLVAASAGGAALTGAAAALTSATSRAVVRIGLAAPTLDRWRHDRAGPGSRTYTSWPCACRTSRSGHGSRENPIYQVGGKSFVFFRNPRPDAVDPVTGERYPDVIVFWVPSESDKQALVQDPGSPFFTTPHFDGHPSVLVRGSRIGELTVRGTDRGDRGRLAVAGLPRQSRGLAQHPARRLARGGCG